MFATGRLPTRDTEEIKVFQLLVTLALAQKRSAKCMDYPALNIQTCSK